ncbi:hypothetical protein SETIT_9G135400v2 [Setaria italica]|uniref:Protein kinase domain-containing protein n=1 Tax=Setaria italica TaxID=4555 RepID=A0A368SG64_SETIT|nr:hypothetical protein SETIT_9G135400v2 [Setaria italica]
MGNAFCRARSAAVASAPLRERQRQPQPPDQPPRLPDRLDRGGAAVPGRRPRPPDRQGALRLQTVPRRAAAVSARCGSPSACLPLLRLLAPAASGRPRTGRGGAWRARPSPWSSLKRLGTVEDPRRELSVMASLPRHPALVRLHEVYEDEAAVHLVMDLCDGGSLAAGGRAVRVARALHEAGVMHRDIKPENLMFSGRGAEEKLMVIDFGFAINFRPEVPANEQEEAPIMLDRESCRTRNSPQGGNA